MTVTIVSFGDRQAGGASVRSISLLLTKNGTEMKHVTTRGASRTARGPRWENSRSCPLIFDCLCSSNTINDLNLLHDPIALHIAENGTFRSVSRPLPARPRAP